MTVLDAEAIERESSTADLADIITALQRLLGDSQTVAFVAGLQDAKMIGKWLNGTEPRKAAQLRLRYAYMAARLIDAAFDQRTVEAWFFGSNSRLDDEAPAWVLRHAQGLDDLRGIMPAAKAFADPGRQRARATRGA